MTALIRRAAYIQDFGCRRLFSFLISICWQQFFYQQEMEGFNDEAQADGNVFFSERAEQ